MKGTLRFLSLSIRWATVSVCCALAISGLSHLSASSQYMSDLAPQNRNDQSTIRRANAVDPIQRLRTGLVNQPNHAAFDFLVSPLPQAGSSKIAFTSNRDGSMQIYIMNSDGTGQTRLTYSGANDDCPRWSPNGTKIIFQSDRDHPDTGYMDIYVMNSDGSGVTRLTTDVNDDSMAAWSPGGTKIVFQSMRNGVNYQVYSMNADGSNQVNLTNTSSSDGEPSCSPDGSKIVFASDRDHTGFDSTYVMNSDGANQQRITFSDGDVEDTQPMWSQDGSRIAFVSTRDSTVETWQETEDDGNYITKSRVHVNKEVYVMNADGSGQTRLTTELANDDSPSWSPDGSKITFRSDRERDGSDPSSQVWVMNPDGTGQTDLSPTNDGDYSANWVLGWTAGDGGGDVSPDATANSVTINFDTQPQGAVIFDQYQSAIFSATGFSSPPGGCGSVVMGVTGERYSSFPNGIRTGARCNYNSAYAGLYVSFPIPVSNLSFNVLNMPQSFFAVGGIDVYQNGNYYGSFGLGGGNPNSAFPVTFLRSIPHITGIYVYQTATVLQLGGFIFDDFTFTPELTVDITNPRVSGGLDETTRDALLGADISLQAKALRSGSPVTGGTYSWSCTGPVSGCSQTGQSIAIRSTDTSNNAGPITAKVTYTLNGVSVTASVSINSILPTLTSYTGELGPDLVARPNACASPEFEPPWWFYRLGCGSLSPAMNFIANVHAPTFISEPSQSGVKYVQAISAFMKYTQRGLRCVTRRTNEGDVDSGWELDTSDPANLPGYPIHRFNEGNDLTALMVDAPKQPLTGISSWESLDNFYVDDQFQMYLVYFVGSDPANPLIQRPIGKLRWNWGGLVEFKWIDSLDQGIFNLRQTTSGLAPGEPTNSPMVAMSSNVKPIVEVPCPGGGPSLTNNKIDSSRFFVRRHYLDFLGREPDDSGWDFWTNEISQCGFDLACIHSHRVNVGLAFFYSSEFILTDPEMANPPGTPGFNPAVYNRKFVYWCYQKYLRRDPHDTTVDQEGWQFWTDDLNGNGNYAHTIDAFQLSGDYRNRVGNN